MTPHTRAYAMFPAAERVHIRDGARAAAQAAATSLSDLLVAEAALLLADSYPTAAVLTMLAADDDPADLHIHEIHDADGQVLRRIDTLFGNRREQELLSRVGKLIAEARGWTPGVCELDTASVPDPLSDVSRWRMALPELPRRLPETQVRS
jgi:hypothetical protein